MNYLFKKGNFPKTYSFLSLILFLGRDGRLYDLMIDSLGVITVYYILKHKLFNIPIKLIAYPTYAKQSHCNYPQSQKRQILQE
ncbi:MAG: hypothetical protein C5B52_10680 [Bacteroidetes bacterium]|nr:MAG: hypothetical protein C5B52_10680 [Bacteroidota bacterium]